MIKKIKVSKEIKDIFRMIEFIVQYIVLGAIYYIIASVIIALSTTQNSFWKNAIIWFVCLVLFRKFIIKKLKKVETFGKYTSYIEIVILFITVIILVSTLGILKVTL